MPDLSHIGLYQKNANRRRKLPYYCIFGFTIIGILVAVYLVIIMRIAEKEHPAAFTQITNRASHASDRSVESHKAKDVIGFLPSWTVAQESYVVPLENITQLIYFGLGVNANGELIMFDEKGEPVLEWLYFTSEKFQRVQKDAAAQGKKTLIAIKSFDNETIDTLISSNAATKTFIAQLQSLITKYELDGVNLDFEYFTDSNFPTARYFTPFLQQVKSTLTKESPDLILSVDINATVVPNDPAYEGIVAMSEIVDYVILMSYEYHQQASTYAGPIAPLYAAGDTYSVNKSVQSLLGRVPREKIILGVPFYGYEWQTESSAYKSKTIMGSGALATYKRIQKILSAKNIPVKRDAKTKSPWIVYSQAGVIRQVYYEDEQSIAEKLSYVHQQKLAGIAIWALGYEGQDKTLLKTINQALHK